MILAFTKEDAIKTKRAKTITKSLKLRLSNLTRKKFKARLWLSGNEDNSYISRRSIA